ncbi:hypothetical protein V499_03145 [Pseudogymnoascus sp. VKM F-103]|nr:hypothetical protein V499_03145 [Pseudogymnoascus sp. VKM F-103]
MIPRLIPFLEASNLKYGKNNYQANSVAASSELSIPIWKERLPSRPSRSFLGTFKPPILLIAGASRHLASKADRVIGR